MPSLRRSYLSSTAVASHGLGLLFRNSSTATILCMGEVERVGGKEGWMPRRMSLVTVIRDMVREHAAVGSARLER